MYNYEQDPARAVESLRDERVRHLETGLYFLKAARAKLPDEAPSQQHHAAETVIDQNPLTSSELERLAAVRAQIEKEAA